MLATAVGLLITAESSSAENRTFDGTGNNPFSPNVGAANARMIRFEYDPAYPDGIGNRILTDAERANPRDISNLIAAQSRSLPNTRRLTTFITAWSQFLTHDLDLSSTLDGAVVNGTAPIAVLDPNDPLGPGPIPFVRSNFRQNTIFPPFTREQVNAVTSFIDASQVYGSDATRAAALRTNGGMGAKLLTSPGGLLPLNTMGLRNDNSGSTPDDHLFVAGDVRVNENVMLTSLQTVFLREHNRLVDLVAAEQPSLVAEEQYQLARKIVGAQMQVITYKEFLPALLGQRAPVVEDYSYSALLPPDITQSFAHAAFRFGHSTATSDLSRVATDGAFLPPLLMEDASFNPGLILNEQETIDQLLRGAGGQAAEEVDVLVVDSLRNALFGPPGAGGLDLAAIDIQRGRDHGLPDYNELRQAYRLDPLTSFDQITSDPILQLALADLYGGNINNVDAWVGILAENHLPRASAGPLLEAIVAGQFTRLRDGDRLFYTGDDLGLYEAGHLRPSVRAIVDLDSIRLSDIIRANTGVSTLQGNVFFLVPEPATKRLIWLLLALLAFGKANHQAMRFMNRIWRDTARA